MNVAVVVHNYDLRDGTGGYAAEMVPRIAKVHDVTLYAVQVRTPVPLGVRWVRVPALRSHGYATILTFPAAFAAVRGRHDLIHAQGWVTSQADVVTAHIVLAAWRDAARRNNVTSPLGERMLGWFVQARESGLLRRATRLIAPSARARDDIARCYGRSSGVTVVHHGFPVAPADDLPAARRTLALPPEGIIALFVGDLRKGFDVALEAVRQVPGVRLAVVSRSAHKRVTERAARAGMLERLIWIGALENMAPAYCATNFLLHPTIYDTFGLVVAEAMAHGLPVVTTSAAGIAELIHHGESGWLVEGDAAQGTVAAVRALAQDSALRHRLGAGGRAVAGARPWDDAARETLAVYEEAWKARAAR